MRAVILAWCLVSCGSQTAGSTAADSAVVDLARSDARQEGDCEGPEAEAWVRQKVSDLLERDGLLSFALSEFGPVSSCVGEVTQEFDGNAFGRVAFEVVGGVSVEFETMPPAVWVARISHQDGFIEESRILDAARSYARGLGLQVAWEEPERSSVEGIEREHYWDPDPGTNGSVTVMRLQEVLIGVTVSMAP